MQIQAYYTDKTNEGKLSQNTLRKHHDLLKAAFKMAVQQEMMVRMLKRKRIVPSFLTSRYTRVILLIRRQP